MIEPVHHPRPDWTSVPTLGVGITAQEDPRDETGGTTGCGQRRASAPFFEYSPPWWGPGSWEDREAKLPLLDFDLEAPLELGPEVDCSLQELVGSSEEDNRNRSSPEPLVEEYKRWVTWRAQAHNMPGWRPELAEVPGVHDPSEGADLL